jgi:threonine dehydrogenase-like Zn-dependent dehydrogenase
MKEKYPKVETLDYSKLKKGESVTSKLKEMVDGRGPDVALECVAGEYAKGWAHYFEMMLGMETDTSEIVNEMITSVRNFGRCGITGVYVGFVRLSRANHERQRANKYTDQPFQHRVSHGTRYPSHRQRPGTCAFVLGEVAWNDPEW